MQEIFTLTCPNCGAPLKISPDMNRFVCMHCGTENIVRRGEGTISLAPVTEKIEQVKNGIDKTNLNLAIMQLTLEIKELEQKLEKKTKPKRGLDILFGPNIVGIIFSLIGIFSLFVSLFANSNNDNRICFPIGIIFIFIGVFISIISFEKSKKEIRDQIKKKKIKIQEYKRILNQE